jgi:hypothetical protein
MNVSGTWLDRVRDSIQNPGRLALLIFQQGSAIEWLIKRLMKVRTKVSYHGPRWEVHVASAFPLAHDHRAVFWVKALVQDRV